MEELPDSLRLVEVLFTVTVNVALWAPVNEIGVAHSLLDSSCIEDFNDRIHFIGDRVIQAIVNVTCDKKSFKVIDTEVIPTLSLHNGRYILNLS